MVFSNEKEVKDAFNKGELNRDVAVVVRGQGPRANGMPELHGLTPLLGAIQDGGHAVMLVTDGRMSGASGHCQKHRMAERLEKLEMEIF